MVSRIVASVILIAGVAALAWVAFGGTSTETTTVPLRTGNSSGSLQSATGAAPDAADSTQASNTATDASEAEVAPRAATPESTATAASTIVSPDNYGPRMDLVELDGWLNTDATSIDDFDGKVILVEMWTFGCHNCKARIPFNQSYYEEFKDENFEIVGVHAPEFSYEADVANIENALVELGVDWPIALDTNKKNFRAWQPGSTNFWPRTYVIDQNGDIRYDHIGEGKYEELRETLRYLIANPPAPNPAQ